MHCLLSGEGAFREVALNYAGVAQLLCFILRPLMGSCSVATDHSAKDRFGEAALQRLTWWLKSGLGRKLC